MLGGSALLINVVAVSNTPASINLQEVVVINNCASGQGPYAFCAIHVLQRPTVHNTFQRCQR